MPTRPLVPLILIAFPVLTLAAEATYKAEAVAISDMSRADTADSKNNILCGMHVVASAELPSGSSVEWELAISIVTNGQTRVAGVSVGTFSRQLEGIVRTARPPLKALALSVAGTDARTEAHFVGLPNKDNGMVGQISDTVALQIFDALDARQAVIAEFTFDSGDHETLSLAALPAKTKPKASAAHGTSAPVHLCLAHLVAATGGQSKDLVETAHVSQ